MGKRVVLKQGDVEALELELIGLFGRQDLQYDFSIFNGRVDSKIGIFCPRHGELGWDFKSLRVLRRGGLGCTRCNHDQVSKDRSKHWTEWLRLCQERFGCEGGSGISYPTFEEDLRKSHRGRKGKGGGTCDDGYASRSAVITVCCPKHGLSKKTLAAHLGGKFGCRKCGFERVGSLLRTSFEGRVAEFRAIHGDTYDYIKPDDWDNLALRKKKAGEGGCRAKIKIVCKKHGVFEQTVGNHLKGHGCWPCHLENRRLSLEDVAKRGGEVHGKGRYEYLSINGAPGNDAKLLAGCGVCGKVFKQAVSNHLQGAGCPRCARSVSRAEIAVSNFVKDLVGVGVGVLSGRGVRLPGAEGLKLEADIVVPSKKVAIEYHGLIWHSERFARDARGAHARKRKLALAAGWRLIQIFEDEWLEKPEQVKGRLRAVLGIGIEADKIGGRQCVVRELPWHECKGFLERVHLQGPGLSGAIRLGLFERCSGRLRAVMVFGKRRGVWEMLRYACDGWVPGGASKLLAEFGRMVGKVEVVSFADLRWSEGDLYKKLGFEKLGETKPGYFYVKGSKRFNRERFQKHKLGKVLAVFDPELSEVENCRRNKFYRLFDCGHAKWRKVL